MQGGLWPLRPRLMAFAMRLERSTPEAEELVSYAMFKAIHKAHQYQEGTNLFSWVSTIMANHYKSQQRRIRKKVIIYFDPQPNDDENDMHQHYDMADVDDPSMALELKQALGFLSVMPPIYRDAVFMLAQGKTYEEAATDLGVAVGTVKSRVTRGRHMLRQLLGDKPWEERAA